MVIARNITNSVPTAVWIATLLKTYENFVFEDKDNYWIGQRDIQEIAKLLCPKNIDNARISQWCNGDHPNNTYNYLRAKGPLRRLTKPGEFSGHKEQPRELPINTIIFENKDITLMNIVEWYKSVYCKIQFDEIEPAKINHHNISTEKVYLKDDIEIRKHCSESKDSKFDDIIPRDVYDSSDINSRAINIVISAWEVFSRKVGNGLIPINKEASMQLQYAYILKHMLPLVIFQDDEEIELELETTVNDGTSNREVDIMVIVYKGDNVFKIALELKCYKTRSSSGGNRGATDIFMKDIYQDMHLLERYCENNQANVGIALVMNDYKSFVYPKKKEAKCWDYDISQGTKVGNIRITTPIGGKSVDIILNKQYQFNWKEIGEYTFLLLKPVE